MGLNLDPDSQAAVDLAKRALPKGGQLDVGLLMAALYHSAKLKKRFPQLGSCLPRPSQKRKKTPDKVPVDEALRPVLSRLARKKRPLGREELFAALIDSDVGRGFLLSGGVTERDLTPILATLRSSAMQRSTAQRGRPTGDWRGSQARQTAIEALSSFGRMLTVAEPPHRGVVEMEKPLRSLIRTLSRMRRRNAIIIGHPGTGKSALVYELARRLVREDKSIPARLRDHDVFELSPSFLRSGASLVGQYDERVKSLLQVLRAHPKIILFIDEIHSLLHSGMHQRGPFSEANESFKSALGLGEISLIGCTTTAEYRHYIEPDGALARRFSIIKIDPPTPDATFRILEARRPKMEEYYGQVRIPDEILSRTVELTEEYVLTRFQPDKSIQLLDEACAHCITAEPPAKEVTEEALWQALEDIIGHSVVRRERLTVETLFEQLRAKIIGQDDVLRRIARSFISGLGGWAKRSAPRGVFFFCGPTGVGKTETAVLLSKLLGGGRDALVRVDCNTLQGSGHDPGPAINVLLGPPPGYVGYVRGQGGALSKIRDYPESIVLFDEIEKANPGVGKLLLQMIDDGRVEDNEGNTLDFRRSFIIFTTNAGCVYDRRQIGFEETSEVVSRSPRTDVDALKSELRGIGLGEEFLGRIGHFFVFEALAASAISEIIELRLESLRETAEVRGHRLEWEKGIVGHLTSQWQPRFGVRHLIAILRNRIIEQLSVADAQGELKGVKKIRLEILELGDSPEDRDLTGLASRERQGETLVISLV
jgi:ATP-dependent Clp protease ATP-binding subunit ClpA